MIGWLRRRLSRLAAPGGRLNLPDDLWHATLAAYPFLQAVPAADRNRLRDLSTRFLREKEFHGVAGLEVTDAMAIAVAAQACLPLLHLGAPGDPASALNWYDDFVGIVLHPDEVQARREVTDEDGVVHQFLEVLSGEAMEGGPVMLSWADVADAGATAVQGYNVVIHEFAHKIDLRDGAADGCPPLPKGFLGSDSPSTARALWLEQLHREFARFSDRVKAAQRFEGMVDSPWMDPYATESPSEFFAVATEAYFVNAPRLAEESPALHRLLDAFFRPLPPAS